MMKKMMFLAAALLVSALSCTHVPEDGGPIGDNPYKSLELTTKQSAFLQEGSPFAYDFIAQVNASTDKDYFISPLSMQFLLGMILSGAKDATADEICRVLGYGDGEISAVNEFCASMLSQLPSLDKATTLTLADAIVVDEGFELNKDYKKTVEKYYDASVSNLPFSDRKGSADKINSWCSEHTNGLINKILDETDPDMLCYLLNAIYFKSRWASPFRASNTEDEDFTRASGAKVKVPMMKQNHEYRYLDNGDFQAVTLPYGNGAFKMTVILPAKGKTVADVADALLRSVKEGELVIDRGGTCDVDLWLPKFTTQFHIKLNKILSEMGMPSSFDPAKADFSVMSKDALYLSFVQQDALIKVDEQGTEAAAVSSAGMAKTTSVAPSRPAVFHADRPFLYLIRESSTGAVLFAGRYGAEK